MSLEGLTGVVAIGAGYHHSLALKDDGTVVAWGNNDDQQSNVPNGLTDVIAIAPTAWNSLALQGDGTVVAWGSNDAGQTDVPDDLTGVTAIAAGYRHNLALKDDGTITAWGGNESGQTSVPAGLTGVTAITAGAHHSLALTALRAPSKTSQSITWTTSGTGKIGTSVALTGTASSGLPVSYTLDAATKAGTCTVTGTHLVLKSAGPCVVNADQAGNDTHEPAPQLTRTVTVAKPATVPPAVTPARTPTLELNKSKVRQGGHMITTIKNATSGQRYVIRFRQGRILAKGRVAANGTVVRRLDIPNRAGRGNRVVKARLFSPKRVLLAPVRVTR